MIYDRMEGLFVDDEGVQYEIVGSCSFRTHEFELIGLSKNQNSSLKIKGTF